MTPVGTSKCQLLAGMRQMFRRMRVRMKDLGLNFTVWDREGFCCGEFDPAFEFCHTLGRAGAPCADAARELAVQIDAEGAAAWRQLPCGCSVIGVPIRKRRRVIGTAVVCYPTRQWLDQEFRVRWCGTLQLDSQLLATQAREACRHGADELRDLLRVSEWLLEGEQSLHVANQELANLSANLSTTYEELSLLYTISGSMKVTQQPQDFLLDVCRELREVMNISAAAAVVYAHPPATQKETVVVAGDVDLSVEQVQLLAVSQIAPLLAKSSRAVVDNQFVWRMRPDLSGAVRNLIAIPLVGEQAMGMLLAINKNVGDFNSVDIKLMSSIGNQSAVFLTNSMLYADLQDLLMGVLHALTATIDAKDPYTCGHSNRVAIISRRLAEECGLPPARVQQVYLAGLLHDIGKIGVPESTLCKPGRLTEEEYESIKKHPGIGAKILGGIRQLDDVIPGILGHHERLDGRGYPQGLHSDEVTFDARIIGLADCFDAMTSDRIYRKALPLEAVLAEIRQHAGTQFDRDVVEKFLALDLEAFLEELRQPAQTVFPVTLAQEGEP